MRGKGTRIGKGKEPRGNWLQVRSSLALSKGGCGSDHTTKPLPTSDEKEGQPFAPSMSALTVGCSRKGITNWRGSYQQRQFFGEGDS